MKIKNLGFLICTLLLASCLLPNKAFAQEARIKDQNNNGWYMYFGDHKLSDKFGLHTEVQVRRYNVLKDPQQLLLRGGVNYNLTPTAMATVGYGYIETHPYGDYPAAGKFPEHRIYEQLQLKGSLGVIEMTHRYRLEQRWVKPAGAEEATYLNRARYFLRGTLPLLGSTLEAKEPYLAVYDEVLIGFGKNVQHNIFDQNRAYIAIGYKLSSAAAVEAGYLNQIVQKSNGVIFEHNHTLQLGLTYNLDFTAKP
jgi:hypothetical protein